MQSILTCAINIIVITFLALMALDFIVGWFSAAQKTMASQDSSLDQRLSQASQFIKPDGENEKEESKLTSPLQTSSPPIEPITPEVHKIATSTQIAETKVEPVLESLDRPTFDTFSRKTSFEQVCADFAKSGFTFERNQSGRYKYRVIILGASPVQFKKLQEAVNWLASDSIIKSNQLMSPNIKRQTELESVEVAQVC